MTEKTIPTLVHSEASNDWAASTDRVPVFHIRKPFVDEHQGDRPDGWQQPDDEVVTYTMPSKPNAGLALAYLKLARRANADVAMSWLIETAVGEEGYDALADDLAGVESGDEAQRILTGITERIQRVAMGGLDPKG